MKKFFSNLFFEAFRIIGVVSGLGAHLLFFKKKIYYENRAVQRRRVRGGAVIISNHINPLDYVLNVVLFFPRKLWVVASEDAYRNKLQAFGMTFFGGICADRRTKSLRFVDRAADVVRDGGILQIFPEGHNSPDGEIHKFYPSYILIAERSGRPIIPVVTDGNYGLFSRTHVIIGVPIELPLPADGKTLSRAEIYEINDRVRGHVISLRRELDLRVEADKRKKRGKSI